MSSRIPSFLSPKASSILLQLLQAYGFDLFDFNSNIYLRLEQDGFMPLVLERLEPNIISLSHYYVQNGDLMADPDVTLFIYPSKQRLLLFPLTYKCDGLGIYQELAYLNEQRNNIKSFKSRSMADVTKFCNQWARNIQAQAWFLSPHHSNPQVSVITS